MIASLAFLGPKYDYILREVYTKSAPKDIFDKRYPFSVIFDDALADSAPLHQLLIKDITPDMLKEIAQEHERG
ncbi:MULTISPECIES: hypothetical protein [Nitrosomonas]|uniref:Uncharacterized protein n=1 Tax=Nitrosomonas communis TaxID=44574 RepID=A0A5D3YB53_9PROT|nr:MULTISPECIES: hypothetical protein [Nitrosomonas]TYP71584.1 hypothetical protein BCL69_11115 [Nitrosomonas communis]UVS59845.1 hypothetical protein NX761_09800 [Nitrosomonas sp. PLL12]